QRGRPLSDLGRSVQRPLDFAESEGLARNRSPVERQTGRMDRALRKSARRVYSTWSRPQRELESELSAVGEKCNPLGGEKIGANFIHKEHKGSRSKNLDLRDPLCSLWIGFISLYCPRPTESAATIAFPFFTCTFKFSSATS